MSWPAVGWALGQQAPSSAAKFLLVMLADAASIGDWLSWPSVAYLSDATQQDRKTVLSNLQKLQQANLIAPHGKTGRTRQIAVWKLPVTVPNKAPKAPKNGTLSTDQTVPVLPAKSPSFPAKESQKRDTEPVIDPVNEPKDKERERASRAARSPVKTSLPNDFGISERVQKWAAEKGFGDLPAHLEHFMGWARASGHIKADWDEAFMNAIRGDWIEIRGRKGGKGGKAPKAFAGTNYSEGVSSDGRII